MALQALSSTKVRAREDKEQDSEKASLRLYLKESRVACRHASVTIPSHPGRPEKVIRDSRNTIKKAK